MAADACGRAAYFGHPQCIRHLLKFRAEVDSLDSYGGTPLVAAALNGEVECVQALLDAGADVNHATTNLNTPLMKAALNGHVACVRVLLGWGADATRKNSASKTAAGLAEESVGKERERLARMEGVGKGECRPRSIEERRRKETIRRLNKAIEDHESVLADLVLDKDAVRELYPDLFSSLPERCDAAVQAPDRDSDPLPTRGTAA